jgi:putative phosphoesterase
MNARARRIGLISDTHDLLRPEATRALHGSDEIIHAGDICARAVLDALAGIAPVSAVRGNNDRGAWADLLPATAIVRIDAVSILVVHDLATLDVRPAALGVQAVIAGHSHQPRIEHRDGVLYVNPGSAGPRRFRLPVSVAHLLVRGREIEARLCELTV